jgi:5S rRNA maturation endonuclease (ribonuclease M5)
MPPEKARKEPTVTPAVRGGAHLHRETRRTESQRRREKELRWGNQFEIFDDLEEFVDRLNRACGSKGVVVVEGRRDEGALRSIGFTGSVLMLCHNNSLRSLVKQIGKRRAVLLFDNDREGEKLARRAKDFLEACDVSVDVSYRKDLLPVTRGKVRQIEELRSFKNKILKRTDLI